ncbi:MAG: TIR domain-containing protein [Sedimenticola sp.]
MSDKQKNVFISHYGKDDEHVGGLKDLLAQKGYTLKNSSIDSTKPNQANNEDYIRQLLRSRIDWAGTTIVLIGPQTHTREWVDWEIEQSEKAGNRIVGVYIEGATDADVPESFEKFGDALVGWQSDRVIDAIEGTCNNWEKTDGSERESKWSAPRSTC